MIVVTRVSCSIGKVKSNSKINRKTKIKIGSKVKGSGQECPLYTKSRWRSFANYPPQSYSRPDASCFTLTRTGIAGTMAAVLGGKKEIPV